VQPQHVPDHVVLNAVVFDDIRVAYVPVPKAASTSILTALFEVAELNPDDRARSRKLEVTRGLTVHDGSLWGQSHRLLGRSTTEVEWILDSEEWFTFSVVREPVRRIWSGWVSKVLTRNPRFVLMLGEDVFPPPPSNASDVVESFRRFMTALPDRPDWNDSHWSPQAELLGVPHVRYDHIGRVEQFDRTEWAVREEMRLRNVVLPVLGVENRSPLPFSSGVFDRMAHEACSMWTEPDREAFGYEPVAYTGGEPDERWLSVVEANIPAIRTLIEQNERFLDVWQLMKESEPPKSGAPSLRHRLHSVRTKAISARGRGGHRVTRSTRVVGALVALFLLLVLLPESLGDRPYDPRPSAVLKEVEHF
jgi:Sulfotransferase family